MNAWELMSSEAIQIYDQTLIDTPREVALLSDGISLYADGLRFSKDPAEPAASTVRMALLSHNLNTLKYSIDGATRGYYIQAMALLRNVYENWLGFWYLAKLPAEASRWLTPRWDQRPPTAETMRNKIDHPSKESKSALQGYYVELNRFAHTDPIIVITLLTTANNRAQIRVGLEYSKEYFRIGTYALSLWTGQMLDAVESTVPENHEWRTRHAAHGDRILAFLDEIRDLIPGDTAMSE